MSVKNKFTITISDMYGSKHYLLHQIIKRFVLYFTLFVVFLIVIGSYLISALIDEVDTLGTKKEKIIKEQILLKQQNDKLLSQIKEKTEKFDEIKEKIADMEALIGITPSLETNTDVRLQKIKFTVEQQKIIFENIPNGSVVPYKGFSAKFGWRMHPILKRKEFHKGLDLRAKLGTPVRSPANGIVELVRYNKSSGYGNLVIIDHNYGFKTRYGHLSKMVVKPEQVVKKGDLIAYTGSSGLSTGPHLHYEIRFLTRPLNPLSFVKWNKSNFQNIFKKEKRVPWQSLINIMQDQLHLQKQPS